MFVSEASCQIVTESLSFCRRVKQLRVNAYVIMLSGRTVELKDHGSNPGQAVHYMHGDDSFALRLYDAAPKITVQAVARRYLRHFKVQASALRRTTKGDSRRHPRWLND